MTRKMKDSGIEWIGLIPEEWQICKLKNICDISGRIGFRGYTQDDLVEEGEGAITLSPSNFSNMKMNYNKCSYISWDKYFESPEIQIENGHILFVKTGSTYGKSCLVSDLPMEATINPQMIVIKNIKISNKYLAYFLQSKIIENQTETSVVGGTIPTIAQEKIKNFVIIFPNKDMQQRIVNYLDSKIGEIDSIISKTKLSIDKYKMYKKSIIAEAVTKGIDTDVSLKESGIAWASMIPEHWEVKKGKHILKLLERPVLENDDVITCFRDGEVTLRKNRREEGFTFSMKEIGYQGIEPNDLVIHGMDGFAGAIGISDSRGKASPVLNVCDSSQNKRYIMYYLRNMAYSNVFTALATGIRVRSCDLRWKKLAELLYTVPPLDEQRKIADYLDAKCVEVDDLIAKKEAFVEEMEAYKKSLIYEYVTGKKEVL